MTDGFDLKREGDILSRLQAANNAQTALTALMDASVTTCTVVSGDILPAVPFRATIDNEIIEVGAKAGNDLSSILRGQEGTTAAAHQSGSLIEAQMTAGMYGELLSPDESLTVSQATAPTGNTGTISQILGYLANRIKAITGKTNWYDTPSKTLEDVSTHIAGDATSATVHGLRYEEGNWTPTLYGTTTSGSHTYNVQLGKYIKINKKVTCYGNIRLSAKDAAMAGSVRLGGLPFTVGGTVGSIVFGYIANVDFNSGELMLTGYPVAGTTRVDLTLVQDATTPIGLQPAAISNTTELLFTIDYYIS